MTSALHTSTVSGSVGEATAGLRHGLEGRGIELFAVIDHGAGALSAGLELGDEVVVIFGNPALGTHLMRDVREIGLELPLRILLWDDHGLTKATYTDPHVYTERFGLKNSDSFLDVMGSLLKSLVVELGADAEQA